MNYLKAIDFNQLDFADLYDELPLWSAPFGLTLLDRVPIKTDLTILDVGAGTGFLSLELAQRCGPDAKVIAVDPWRPGMQRLRAKIGRLEIRNIVLLEEGAEEIDLPDDSIDLIVSNLGLNNFEKPEEVLKSCFRVAKPGAKLFLTTNLSGHMKEFYSVYRDTLIELGRRDRLAALDAHINHRGTVESVRNLATEVGFFVERFDTQDFRMRFANGSSLFRHYFIRLGFMDGWKNVAPQDAIESTFSRLEQNLNQLAAEQGELNLTIPMTCVEASKRSKAHVLNQ
jgi:arsenite methyltransferase